MTDYFSWSSWGWHSGKKPRRVDCRALKVDFLEESTSRGKKNRAESIPRKSIDRKSNKIEIGLLLSSRKTNAEALQIESTKNWRSHTFFLTQKQSNTKRG